MSRGISGSGRLDQGLAESSRQACSYKPEAQASGSALIQARSASERFGANTSPKRKRVVRRMLSLAIRSGNVNQG